MASASPVKRLTEVGPGAPPNVNSAVQRIDRIFFDEGGYSLSPLGRHTLNRKFVADDEGMQLSAIDLMRCIAQVLLLTVGEAEPDDVNHLGQPQDQDRGGAGGRRVRGGTGQGAYVNAPEA